MSPEPTYDEHEEKILIVDDEEGIRDLLADQLMGEGYPCLVAATAFTPSISPHQDDVSQILTDIRMPGLDGMSL